MKRSYEEANGSAASSARGSPSACAPSPNFTHARKRGSTSPVQQSSHTSVPPVGALSADASGRITRIPTISRKVRACSACKKQKIRCDFEEGEASCVRCKKMKLECVVNRSLQTILDDDIEWKHKVREDTMQLQCAVEEVLASLSMRPLASYCSKPSPPVSRTSSEPPNSKDPLAQQPQHHHDRGMSQPAVRFQEPNHTTMKLGYACSHRAGLPMSREYSQVEENDVEGQPLFSNPMGSLYEVTRLRGLRGSMGGRYASQEADADFIARGFISLAEAQKLFTVFRDDLNQYLYNIALVHDDLESARASSSLLTSAIFTVTALHVPHHHHLFPTLYQEFLNVVSTCMFDQSHRLDDIRGLCIGAFWLMEISWKLSGHAVRIATEMGIHQSFGKALAGSRECYERARLWYLLYVCDHHFSIAYGRPPVIHDHEPMRKWESYLQSPMATHEDTLVLSQVTLFTILTRIFHFYEDEAENEIAEEELSHIPVFNSQLGNWRNSWRSRLPADPVGSENATNFVGDCPGKSIELHYHFAKLQLNSLALRGASPSTIQTLSLNRKEHANIAISSAIAVLSIILEERSIRNSLVGVPLYINTMIAFAAVFLLKITAKWKSISNISTGQVRSLVGQVITLLNTNSLVASEFHIIPHVAAGLGEMLRKCTEFANSKVSLDDTRMWDSAVHQGGILGNHLYSLEYHSDGEEPSTAAYTLGHGHPQQHHHHQHQQLCWQLYQSQLSHQKMSGAIYSQNNTPPQSIHNGHTGHMYEANGANEQYFGTSAFDFLLPQLPY